MENREKIRVKKDQVIAKQKETVRKWYIIMEGSVVQSNSYARILLEKNSIIGFSEVDRYLCNYVANQDTILVAFPFDSSDALRPMISSSEKNKEFLLNAVLRQRQKLLETYAGFHALSRQYHTFVENIYSDYMAYCTKYQLETQAFTRMESFKALEMRHKADNWEINNSASLMQGGYLDEYVGLMKKDDGLCIGAIMEASYQSRRIMQGLIEMVEYLKYEKDVLLAESEYDMFRLYFDMILQAGYKELDVTPLQENMGKLAEVIRKLGIYEEQLVAQRLAEYQNYNFADGPKKPQGAGNDGEEEINLEDGFGYILNYAGIEKEAAEKIKNDVESYRSLPDLLSTDDTTRQLRRRITTAFYDVYTRVCLRVLEEKEEPSPILQMFLNFGFMDMQTAGEENAKLLYSMMGRLQRCCSEHVYTVFAWLKSIYEGKNEPSKNEFDMDYPAYLADMRKNGNLTADEAKSHLTRQDMKVKYEISNMISSGNRATYGKISTFCPILCSIDLINSVDKMLVTAKKVEESVNKIRNVDYSVFYREILFSDPAKGINSEMIMKEVLPDVILMPNAGTRAMMWQELGGVKKDTSARYLLPIFTVVDIDEMMMEITGRYRWEICRRIQGVRWNDIRERSLTSEYCDYIQFYRKNHDLSVEAKEKLKHALAQGKNNYREVFVKDYQNWLKYESRGSFRLNKVAREILISYCPFPKPIRDDLSANPMYQNSMRRYEIQMTKKAQRLQGVFEKYKKAGGVITKELEDGLEYFYM